MITIVKTPGDFQPTRSDGVYFVVSSDKYLKPKFKYVFDVFVNGYSIYSGKATPSPEGLGILDISQILDTYVSTYPIALYQTTPLFVNQTSPFSRPYTDQVINYYVKVGEEYAETFLGQTTGFTGTGNVGFPAFPSNTYKVFSGTMGVNRNANQPYFNVGQFTLSGNPQPSFPNTQNCLFLTNSPRIRDIDPDLEYGTLSFLNGVLDNNFQIVSQPYYVTYKFYDDTNTLISSTSVANIYSNGGGPLTTTTEEYYTDWNDYSNNQDYCILNVGVAPKNIANFPSNTSYYTVQLFGNAPGPSPTPQPTRTPTPTPSVTISPTPGLSPTPTRTASPTPTITPSISPSPSQGTVCSSYQISNSNGFGLNVSYIDCNGISSQIFVALNSSLTVCARSVTPAGPNVTITTLGLCPITLVPTPTPSSTALLGATDCSQNTVLNITQVGWLKYTNCSGTIVFKEATSLGNYTITECCDCNSIAAGIPFSNVALWNTKVCGIACTTPIPTPSVSTSAAGPKSVYVRDCCTQTIQYQAAVDGTLNVGDVISYGGYCFEIYQLGGNGSVNMVGSQTYYECNECISYYPCAANPNIPTVQIPDVEPSQFAARTGTAPSIVYQAVSEVFEFHIQCKLNPYGNNQVIFKNRYGTYDYFMFNKGRQEALDIQRETYGQTNVTWGSSNPTKTTYSRNITDFNTRIRETQIMNTGYINNPEFVWLEELFTSSDVYLIDERSQLFPINIISTEFIRKTQGNHDIYNIEVSYQYSNNINLFNQ